jgi:hypothetical protein
VSPTSPSGNEVDLYTDTDDNEGEWATRHFRQNTPMNYPDDEEMGVNSDVSRSEMILDQFFSSSPVPVSDPVDENVPATNTSVSRGSWGFPSGYLRLHTRSAITPTSFVTRELSLVSSAMLINYV